MKSEKGKVDIVRMDTDKKDETEDESEKFRKIKCRYFNKGFYKYRKVFTSKEYLYRILSVFPHNEAKVITHSRQWLFLPE